MIALNWLFQLSTVLGALKICWPFFVFYNNLFLCLFALKQFKNKNFYLIIDFQMQLFFAILVFFFQNSFKLSILKYFDISEFLWIVRNCFWQSTFNQVIYQRPFNLINNILWRVWSVVNNFLFLYAIICKVNYFYF